MSDRDETYGPYAQTTPAEEMGASLITISVLAFILLAVWRLVLNGPPRVFWMVAAFVLMVGAFVFVGGDS